MTIVEELITLMLNKLLRDYAKGKFDGTDE